ncbi:MAG: helix-turn-helix transcriptional regulator [candidate division WOR-3 bacterium]
MSDSNTLLQLGSRLRALRQRSGLTVARVVDLARTTYPLTNRHITRLEHGRARNPGIMTIAGYLAACGAGWSAITDILDELSIPASPQLSPANAEQTTPGAEVIAAQAQSDAQSFRERQSFTDKVRQPTAGQARRAVQRYANYRFVARLIEQTILEMLEKTDVPILTRQLYQTQARRFLGQLWNLTKTQQGRNALSAAATAEPGKATQCLPPRLLARINAQEAELMRLGLDLELVAQVQAAVLASFLELFKSQPELFLP